MSPELVRQESFWHSPEIDKISAALSKAQGLLENASKSALNPHFHSKYADLASVMEACRKPLSDNEIAVIQFPSATETELSMVTMLAHASGQFFASRLCMIPRDNSPQSAGSTITYARRYALAAMVGVAPDDDDAESGQGRGPQPIRRDPPPANRAAPKPPAERFAQRAESIASKAAPPPAPEGFQLASPANATAPPPWHQRKVMEDAFNDVRETVGDTHYFYILDHLDITVDLHGTASKLREAYSELRLRAAEIATGQTAEGAPV